MPTILLDEEKKVYFLLNYLTAWYTGDAPAPSQNITRHYYLRVAVFYGDIMSKGQKYPT